MAGGRSLAEAGLFIGDRDHVELEREAPAHHDEPRNEDPNSWHELAFKCGFMVVAL